MGESCFFLPLPLTRWHPKTSQMCTWLYMYFTTDQLLGDSSIPFFPVSWYVGYGVLLTPAISWKIMLEMIQSYPKWNICYHMLSLYIYTLWLFNIAMENDPFIDGLPGFTYSKWVDLSMATLVITKGYIYLYHSLCKGISPQNMAKNMVLTYLQFRILEISHWLYIFIILYLSSTWVIKCPHWTSPNH